jgi:hypothetical protein
MTKKVVIPSFDDIVLPTSSKKEGEKEPRKASEFWINVGILVEGKLVQLPLGIPLDGLKSRPIPSGEGEFRQLRLAEASLWEQVQGVMGQMEPGQEIHLPKLTAVLRRNKQPTENENKENPFKVSLF